MDDYFAWFRNFKYEKGIADFYARDWKGKRFEVDTDRANTSIKGTEWTVEATEGATVVTVTEGVVAVSDPSGGGTEDVEAGEQATVDGAGIRVARLEAQASEGPASDASAENPLAPASDPPDASSQPTGSVEGDPTSGGADLGIVVAVLLCTLVAAGVLVVVQLAAESRGRGVSGGG